MHFGESAITKAQLEAAEQRAFIFKGPPQPSSKTLPDEDTDIESPRTREE
jgi:hypothetical protein